MNAEKLKSLLNLVPLSFEGGYFAETYRSRRHHRETDSARTEERLMMQAFPDRYPEYKKRTRALIPFVW